MVMIFFACEQDLENFKSCVLRRTAPPRFDDVSTEPTAPALLRRSRSERGKLAVEELFYGRQALLVRGDLRTRDTKIRGGAASGRKDQRGRYTRKRGGVDVGGVQCGGRGAERRAFLLLP